MGMGPRHSYQIGWRRRYAESRVDVLSGLLGNETLSWSCGVAANRRRKETGAEVLVVIFRVSGCVPGLGMRMQESWGSPSSLPAR